MRVLSDEIAHLLGPGDTVFMAAGAFLPAAPAVSQQLRPIVPANSIPALDCVVWLLHSAFFVDL
jgi:hypothetical protein